MIGFIICEEGIPRAFVPYLNDGGPRETQREQLKVTLKYAIRRTGRALSFIDGENPEHPKLPRLADWVDSIRNAR